MLNNPARKAIATDSVAKIKGDTLTSVLEKLMGLPKEPFKSAPYAEKTLENGSRDLLGQVIKITIAPAMMASATARTGRPSESPRLRTQDGIRARVPLSPV